MKREYLKPVISCESIELEHSLAASSDCKGSHHGNGNGNGNNGNNGKGCKADFSESVIIEDDFSPVM